MSHDKLLISGGHVIDPLNHLDARLEIGIIKGRIACIGTTLPHFIPDRVINATGYIVCPGLVDLCARLREPGDEHKATIASETRAAARGGITTLCCPPDTRPIIDTPAVAEQIQRHAKRAGFSKVLPLAALTQGLAGVQLSEMAALKAAGCVAVTNLPRPISNPLVLMRALEYAATHHLSVFLQPVDEALAQQGCVHAGAVSTRLGLPGIPEVAETAAVARDLALIEATGARTHFCRISSARALRLIEQAAAAGLPVSADVSAHHLHLSEADIGEFNSMLHIQPPLRTLHDRAALRAGVAAGVISSICSDHSPHEADAKLAPFPATEPGISALETLLPLTLKLVEEGVLSLNQAITRLTTGPAGVLGIPAGSLSVDTAADVCIFDPHAQQHWEAALLYSRGHNSPFLGWKLPGIVHYTLINGKVVYQRSPHDAHA